GLSQLHPAEVVGFALVELRQQLCAEVGEGAGTAENLRDTSAVCVRVAVCQLRGQPRIRTLQVTQKSGIRAARQVASREQCAGGPAGRCRAELAREHVDGALGELAVGGDLAAEYGEE